MLNKVNDGMVSNYDIRTYSLKSISGFRLPTPPSPFPSSDFRHRTSVIGLPSSDFRLRTSVFGLPSSVPIAIGIRLPTFSLTPPASMLSGKGYYFRDAHEHGDHLQIVRAAVAKPCRYCRHLKEQGNFGSIH